MKGLSAIFGVIALWFCTLVSTCVISQTQEQSPAPGQEEVRALTQVLNLSPRQQSQLMPILKAETPEIQTIKQDSNLSPSEKKSKLQHVHSQTDPLVKSILDAKQYKQWQTIRNDELGNLHMK